MGAPLPRKRHTLNLALNVAGMVLPMLLGVLTVPGLLQRLGQERFGILALGWALVGYFGLLDFGIGRALTQYLASAETAGQSRQEQATVAHAARRLIAGFAIVWALLLWVVMPWLARFAKMSPALQDVCRVTNHYVACRRCRRFASQRPGFGLR